MVDLVFVSALDAQATDPDLPPISQAAQRAGLSHATWCWDDPAVDWSACRLAVLRSPWNYTDRYADFLAWLALADGATRVLNPPALVRWNTDKRYLQQLAEAGAPVIDTCVLEPGSQLQIPDAPEFVLKPTIGAGSQGARRFHADQLELAQEHLRMLHGQGLAVLAQPYLDRVDQGGETALLYFDGEFSHAICKGALLRPNQAAATQSLAPETITPRQPTPAQREVAERVLGCLAKLRDDATPPLYARVDLLDDDQGQPRLLELELAEPSLFFAQGEGSADRLIQCIVSRL